MKRIKMMLLSLALFAVVGGALAFKAKFQINYCATTEGVTATNTTLACDAKFTSKPDPLNQAAFVATTTYDNNDCKTTGLKCTTTSVRLTPDTP